MENEKEWLTEFDSVNNANANNPSNLFPLPPQFLKENGAEIKDVVMALPEPTIQARKQRKFTMFWHKKKIDAKPEESVNKPSVEITEHSLTVEQVAAKFNTKIVPERIQKSSGLNEEEVKTRLETSGKNAITPPPKKSLWLLFLSHFGNLFNVLLLVSGGLSFILYAIDNSQMINLILGAVLLFVATMNSSIEFYQEYKSAEILNSFMSLVPPMSIAVRGGHPVEVPACDLVPGDILALKSGDKIPADVRIIQAVDFKVDNSSITGESEPQERFTLPCDGQALEASNLAFSGTLAVSGEALGIVIRTGDNSVLGQIAKLTCAPKDRPSQMSGEIDLFVKKIALFAFLTALVFFIYGLIMNFGIGVTFSFAIGLFVAFVPQGIPATVTLLLTIAAKRLAKKQVLVKDLQGVETLGAITLLATDKTGTLTQNKMSVVGAWINGQIYSATGVTESSNEVLLETDTPNLSALVDCCSLCTKSKFDPADADKQVEERNVFGDATETGLLRFAANFLDATQHLDAHPKVFEIPFSSATKWHLTVNSLKHPNGDLTLFIKGAPERIVALCSNYAENASIKPWTASTTESFNRAYECFAGRGQRVLAFAKLDLPASTFPTKFAFSKETKNYPQTGYTFLGLVSLMDPPKKGVKKAVAACRTAGIQVVMVTGDHPLTAEAIARKIGLIQGDTAAEAAIRFKIPIQLVKEDQYDAVVIHGDRLDSFTDADWDRALSKREIVFARTSPKHKLEIVTRCQAKGHIVGVSGDGVNDSPALKKADLGISMNKTASDVSKEAASMILLDDNFSSIVTGIAEGRLIFANLKKSIRYTLTHSTPEISAFIVFILLSIPAPISSILVLMIDLGTELGPAISYAFEYPEGDLMLVPPRKVLTTEKKKEPVKTRRHFRQFWLKEAEGNDASSALSIDIDPVPMVAAQPQAVTKPSYWMRFKRFFKQEYTGETLIDNELLVWCYFQGGVIEAIGCFGAYLIVLAVESVPFDSLYKSAEVYFKEGAPALLLTNGTLATAEEQLKILGKAQGAFFVAIVIGQWFNLFVNKHRYSYPYGWDMLKNKWTWIGMLIGCVIAVMIIYIPGLNSFVFSVYPFPIIAILAPIALGIFLFAYEFGRRFLRRKGYFGGIPKRNVNLVELESHPGAMKILITAGWLIFILLQEVLATRQSKIDLTLDLIEMDVSLGAELRAKLTEACANPDVLKDDIIIPAIEEYLEDKDDEEFQKFQRWGWYISAELIRTLATISRPEYDFSVLDELKVHFKPNSHVEIRPLFYICYELLAKIILLRGLSKDLVKISFYELMNSTYIDAMEKELFCRVSKDIFDFFFKKDDEGKRKLSEDQQQEKGKKKRKASFGTIEIEVEANTSESESSSKSDSELSGEYIALYRESDSENGNKNEIQSGDYNQRENFYDISESSSEESQDAEIELNLNEATKILKNPLKAFKTRTHREFKKACDVYLSSAFHEVDKSVLEDVKKVILSSTRDKFEM